MAGRTDSSDIYLDTTQLLFAAICNRSAIRPFLGRAQTPNPGAFCLLECRTQGTGLVGAVSVYVRTRYWVSALHDTVTRRLYWQVDFDVVLQQFTAVVPTSLQMT